jgi:PAS domain S-box-containing protein
MTRCGERNERFIDDSVFGVGPPAWIFWALHLAAVCLWGFTRRPRVARAARVRTEPLPYRIDELCVLTEGWRSQAKCVLRRAAEVALAMVQFSRHEVPGTLWQGDDFILSRSTPAEGGTSVLVLAPVSERPAPGIIARLEHEYSLRDEVDSDWAVRPLVLIRREGRPILILEDPGGEPLNRFLGQPMELSQFLRFAIGLAAALGKLHRSGLIHKDIKPANILVNVDGDGVWLTGFGIASRLLRERQSPEPPEVIAGTLAYMAPEQTGRMNRSIDSRSDLYSLGVTLYEMLTGTLPFKATDPMEWVHCHIARQPVAPTEYAAEIPEPLSALVMKLLAKTAEERYQTAAGLEAVLRRCLAAWESFGRIDPFPLGTPDASDRLMIPERLYGRGREIETLLAAFHRVVASGTPELILVSGYSGIGKSSVVNELHRVLVRPRGLFASGKFDQYKRDIPYATLVQAFQSLVRSFLGQSEAELSRWRDDLREALGLNGQLIVNLIPQLELVIGKQLPVPELAAQEEQRRFQTVFRRFLGVFARAEHPLVLFLDDLQWLDLATLELVKHLVTESELRHFLLVGAYRDNEVVASHALTRTLDEIRRAGVPVREIVLEPLSIADFERLIADTFHGESRTSRLLAQLVHAKTGGNPFFGIQFLTALAEEGLLTFDRDAAAWRWDLGWINAHGFTDNVADLMAKKFDRLPEATQETLQQLACLGSGTDASILDLVLQDSEKIRSALWEAVRAGLIYELGGAYAFTHDRFQEAAYKLIPEDLRAMLHLRMGRLLVARMPQDELEAKVFDVVNQLNAGGALLADQNEKDRVAELNLCAGRKAKTSTAYAAARNYLSVGVNLIGSDAWERTYELAFGLWYERAEAELLIGNFSEAEKLISVLLEKAGSKVDRAAVFQLTVLIHLVRDEHGLAVDRGLECLRLFGIDIPAHPNRQQLQAEYNKIWELLGDRQIEMLADLPPMTDPEMRAAMGVFSVIPASAFHTDVNLLYLVVCHMVNATLRYGTTGASAHGYAELSLILGPLFHRYHDGTRFGKLACHLADKHGFEFFQAKVFFCAQKAMLWTEPIYSVIAVIRHGIEVGVATHDLPYASFSCFHLVTGLLLQGLPLDELRKELERSLDFVGKVKIGNQVTVLLSYQRFILSLDGQTKAFSGFRDGKMSEEAVAAILAANAGEHFSGHLPATHEARCHYWILQLQALFILNESVAAWQAAKQAKALLWPAEELIVTHHTYIQMVDYHYYAALTAAALYETGDEATRSGAIETIKHSLKWLQEWAEIGPATFTDKHRLVLAEAARIEGRDLDAMRLYEEAIQSARQNGFIQNEAIAHEIAGRFYAARGFEAFAQIYLRNARYGYLRWGALGKVRQLEQDYPLSHEERPLSSGATIETPVEQLDLGTVMKVSQAVAGEIVLEQLVRTLMVIGVEHAGAARGLLILPYGEEHRIAAQARTGREEVEVHLQQAPITPSDLPDSLLRYVIRTQESVILDDATVQNMFSEDEYVCRERPRSILCLPLVKQAKLMGVLYLENNLAPGVFTTKRLAMVELLASQAAISLDHARLYADLIQENNDRRKAEEALRASEERWSMLAENTSAGIALTARDGRFIAANLALQKMLGYTELELQERAISDISYEDDRAGTVARLADAEEGQRRVYRLEKRYLRKDGTVMWADVSSVFVPASGSVAAFFSVVIIDITKRRRAEEDLHQKEVFLREAQNELAHVSRVTTMGELAASIAHEVNQPLAGMVNNANASLRWLAGDSPNLAEAREAIRRIARDGIRAGDVIARMRALFKKAYVAKEQLNLNEAIEEVVVLTQSELWKNKVSLRLELAADLPSVMGDRVQLQQVVVNLILNSIQAMSTVKERNLVIRTQADNGSEVRVAVRDSGIGFDAERAERMFDAFHTTKPGGLGMGLSISRSIVESHDGRLWGVLNDGPGATFQFTLSKCQ